MDRGNELTGRIAVVTGGSEGLGRDACRALCEAGCEVFTCGRRSGIVGFTRSLARELGHEGIRANMVSPGWIMTEKQLRLHVTEDDKAGLLRDQALKFLLEPRHVSPAVLFLLSSASSAITGQELVVDGGKFMH